MSEKFTLTFLQEKIGAEYVELNPVTGQPRIISGLNEVWQAIDDNGGVASAAVRFGVPETKVWHWIDQHYIPERFALELSHPDARGVAEIQMPSTGYEDPETRACWPWTWKMAEAELD
jgi:hypothetical protein